MRWIKSLLLVSILTLFLSACERQNLHRYQTYSFGTLIEIKIRSDDKQLADHASSALFSDFDEMHKDWHAWETGKLTQTSAMLAKGEWFTADKAVLPVIKQAKKYSLLSDGLFNPVIGELIRSWGFQGTETSRLPPDHQQIDRLLAKLPTVDDIDIDDEKMRGHNPRIKLDLGAIAKGHAVSAGIQKLREQGIEHALINAGGDLCGIGSQGERLWRIGIRNPSGDGILASIELENDECVFTSGDYERNFTHDGKRYHHIIDPRSGYPADKTRSVTVLHQDGTVADAASTALFIAGPDDWQNIAIKMGVNAVMIVDKQDRIIMSPSIQKRVRLESGNNDNITITGTL